jgi:cytochrome c biogenesis protein CcmG/thiol:disulfide interchange protein DsbE
MGRQPRDPRVDLAAWPAGRRARRPARAPAPARLDLPASPTATSCRGNALAVSPPPDPGIPAPAGGAGSAGRSPRLLLVAALLAVAVVLGATVVLADRRTPTARPAQPVIPAASASVRVFPAGRTAPALRLRTLDGGLLDLAALRGRPVVVNFWASWCAPCVQEAPVLKHAASAYRELPLLRQVSAGHRTQGLAVVGVLVDDRPAAGRAFMRRYGGRWPVGIDPDGKAAARWGVAGGLPQTVFVRADGTLSSQKLGELTRATLDQQLPAILG